MPTEAKAKDLWRNKAALVFMHYYQTQVEEERFTELRQLLGVTWKRDDVDAAKELDKRRRTTPDELFIPLAAIIEPGLMEHVQKTFGRKMGIDPPKWAKSDDVVDLYEQTDQAEFISFMSNFIRPKVVGK